METALDLQLRTVTSRAIVTNRKNDVERVIRRMVTDHIVEETTHRQVGPRLYSAWVWYHEQLATGCRSITVSGHVLNQLLAHAM